MGAMRNAFRNFVECPDPLDGSDRVEGFDGNGEDGGDIPFRLM